MSIGRRKVEEDAGVLGLSHTGGVWTLVALRRGDAGAPREVCRVTAEGASDELASVWPRLTAGLDDDAKRWPVAWALSAGRTLHRRVELPDADEDTTGKLVAVQAEGWLPGRSEDVLYGWDRGADAESDGGRRWVTAVPSDAIDSIAGVLQGLTGSAGPLTAAVSDALALASGADEAGSVLLLSPAGSQTTLVLASGRRLAGVASVDGSPNENEAVWLADVGEAIVSLLNSTQGTASRPGKAIWVGEHLNRSQCDAWASALGLSSSGVAGRSLGETLARGAARATLQTTGPVVLLDDAAGRHARKPVSVKAWVLAGVALVAALGLWAWSDIHAAKAIDASREAHPTLTAQNAELRRQLDLYTLLEKRPPTLLAMLDEFTDKAKGFNPKTLHYDADGSLELSGVLDSSGTIGTLVTDLSKMRTLDSAQLRSQKNEGRDQVAYEIVATPATRFFEAFVPVPKAEVAADAKPGDPPAEKSEEKPEVSPVPEVANHAETEQAPPSEGTAETSGQTPQAVDVEQAPALPGGAS